MTPDEPYQPSLGSAVDNEEISRMTGQSGSAGKERQERASGWQPPQGREGRSLLPPLDEDLDRLLERAEKKLESGSVLSLRETRILACRAAIRLLGSRRPAAVAAGVQALTRMDFERSREKELRRKRTEERKKRRQEFRSMLGLLPPGVRRT